MGLNKVIKKIVDNILSNSTQEPIIVLFGDHGPDKDGGEARSREILNAYYLPNNDYSNLYNEISPVNTFRVIFNAHFGTNFPMVKDDN